MPDEQFKRHTAFKLRIGDALLGKPILDGERFSFMELGNKKIIRVNIIGNIVDKYSSEGEKKYTFLTLDDGSGQIKVKGFGDDDEKLKETLQGQTILTIGVLRFFNNEIYISPEIIKNLPSDYLLVRKLELEKEKEKSFSLVNKETIIALKDSLLKLIKSSEEKGGIEVEEIIMKPDMNSASPQMINQEIQKLLEEGIIFEPRPGKLRYLG